VNERHPWERPLGARPLDDARAEFRVWAPHPESVSVRVGGSDHPMERGDDSVYEVVAPARAGDDYLFLVDGHALPDPCSRWQPYGLRGASRVLEPPSPASFDAAALNDLVIYELHVGTFSEEGTFAAAIPYLAQLAVVGIGAIEIMPVAEFPGARGWGYDGVYISAAQSSYGGPLGLAQLVDAAHHAGLAVILDVVYNHVGASGVAALEAFGPYFTDRHETLWGRAINYDSECVREWVLQSATGWVREFGIDGLRLDAIHSIFDSSPEHIVAAIARVVHEARPRAVVIGEIGLDDPHEHGAPACDAIWVDDFHHSLHVLLTGERDGYYAPFGSVEQLAQAFGHAPPEHFVVYSQNHDQVGNRAYGDRLPASVQPLAALCTLFSPMVPLLFMGEEYDEPAPFQFFSDHIDEEIAQATREGRREEFAAFAQFGEDVPDPQDPETFRHSKLTRRRDASIAELYRDLLRIRTEVPPDDLNTIAFDEQARWLRVVRSPFELICNFGAQPLRLPCERQQLVISTDDQNRLHAGTLEVAPMSGAVTR
jgi:maltooligosyltrehalose trehalohydrolase